MEDARCIKLNYHLSLAPIHQELRYLIKNYPCGEFEFYLQEDLAGRKITIFHGFALGQFNDGLLKLQLLCDVLKRNCAHKISYVAPFLPYTRQDNVYDGRMSFGSKVVAEIINNCGVDEILTYDWHSQQMQSLLNARVQNLSMMPLFVQDIIHNFVLKDVCIVFPDRGSLLRFGHFFVDAMPHVLTINKSRTESELQMNLSQRIESKIAIIIDDMIDSGETILEATKLLLEKGVRSVFVYATHGVFSGNCIHKIATSKINKITVSDSIDHNLDLQKFTMFNVIPLPLL